MWSALYPDSRRIQVQILHLKVGHFPFIITHTTPTSARKARSASLFNNGNVSGAFISVVSVMGVLTVEFMESLCCEKVNVIF